MISAYIALARQLPHVDAVYIDQSSGLRVYTVYRGGERDSIYTAEGQALDSARDVTARFHLVDSSRSALSALPATAHEIYRRD